jgi:hypothetical protein
MGWGMVLVRCEVVRWVSDEPQPGWVEARLTDARGRRWAVFDKPPVFAGGELLTADAHYPVDAHLGCEVIGSGVGADGVELVRILLLGSESVEGQTEFEVTQDQLTAE